MTPRCGVRARAGPSRSENVDGPKKTQKIAAILRKNRQEKNQKFAVKVLVKSGKMKTSKTKKTPKNRAIRRFLGIFARVHGLETLKYDTSPSKKGCFGISLKKI